MAGQARERKAGAELQGQRCGPPSSGGLTAPEPHAGAVEGGRHWEAASQFPCSVGDTRRVGWDMPRSHSRWPGYRLQGSLLPLAKRPRPLTPECYPNPCPSRPWGPPELSVPGSQPAQPPGELDQLSRSYLPPPGGGRQGAEGVWTPAVLRTLLRADRPANPQPPPPPRSAQPRGRKLGKK